MREIILTVLLASTVTPGVHAGGASPPSIRCPSTCTPSSDFPLTAHHTGHLVAGQSSSDHNCYGTLVSPSGHVLTAAHCVVTDQRNALSTLQDSIRLRMDDCCEMDLRVVHVNVLYDSALLLASSEAAQRYGWADIERVSLEGVLNGAELRRAGHGTACGVAPDSNKLDWYLTCSSKDGDSGEALLLPNGKIAGHITGSILSTHTASSFGRTLNNSGATTSFPTYFYNLFFDAPLSFVGAGGITDPVRLGEAMEVKAIVYNSVLTGESPGGELILSFDPPGSEVDCTVTPPQEATVSVHHPGEVVPTAIGGTTVLTNQVVIVRSALPWAAGERREFTCQIVPTSLGPVKIRFRAVLDWLDETHQFSGPREAPERDEQGWPVETLQTEVIDPAATVWTGPTYLINADSATLSGGVSSFYFGWEATLAGVYYEYGQTSAYGSTTPHIDNPTGIPDIAVTGLDCATEYHYRMVLEIRRPEGSEIIRGNDRTFKTLPCNRPLRELFMANRGECRTYVNLAGRVLTSDNPAVLVWTAGLCILGNLHTRDSNHPYELRDPRLRWTRTLLQA